MQWESGLKETAIVCTISWGLPRECANVMGALMEKFWFYVDSGEKGKFHGISGNGWISLVPWNLWEPWKHARSFSWSKILLWSAELYFLWISVPLTHVVHAGPLPHLVGSSCEYLTLLHGCTALWSSDDGNPWPPTREAQCESVCGGKGVRMRNTKCSPGDFIFCDNASLFYAV